MRARIVIVLSLLLLLESIAPVKSYSQSNVLRPLNWDQLLQLWQEESANRLPKNRTRQLVDERGVDFMLDSDLEMKLRDRSVTTDFINDIRKQTKAVAVTIKCEPAECAVTINKEPVGSTHDLVLTSSVLAGRLNIEVSAPDFQSLNADVEVAPGHDITLPFRLEPLKGKLIVNCEPADCTLLINGVKAGPVARRRWEMNALNSDEYNVEARADGFKAGIGRVRVTAPETASLTLSMDVDEWARLTGPQLFDRMIQSLGNEQLINGAAASKSSGRMTLDGDPPGIGKWKAQLVETAIPGKQRWDLNIAGSNWTVILADTNTKSKGDKRYSGTEFGQELERSIRLFSGLRLPAILPAIKTGFSLKKYGDEIGPKLVAESSSDRYTFSLNASNLPQKLLHEHLTVPRSQEEIEFGAYRTVQTGLKLPFVMILRYPDRPNNIQILEFDRIDTTAEIKYSVFK